MPKFFVNSNQIQENNIKVTGQDVNHIKNVLRKKLEDEIIICNSDNSKDYICKITNLNENEIQCEIKEKIKTEVESNIKVSIFQGLPKADKMELIIQKSVELGAFDITPIEMKRCVVRLNEKDKIKKIQRWQKISEVAAKQCERSLIPQINNIISLQNVCNLCEKYDIVLVAYENENKNTLKSEICTLKQFITNDDKNIKIAILIGPEGRNR